MIYIYLQALLHRLQASRSILKPLLYLASYGFWIFISLSLASLLRVAIISCTRTDLKILIYLAAPLIFLPMILLSQARVSIFGASDGVGQIQCGIVMSYGVVNLLAAGLGDLNRRQARQISEGFQ